MENVLVKNHHVLYAQQDLQDIIYVYNAKMATLIMIIIVITL